MTDEAKAIESVPQIKFGLSGEEYFIEKEAFVLYIEDTVNPAREKHGLLPIDLKSAEESYRILNDFAIRWRRNPITKKNQ